MRPIKFRGKRVDNGEWVYGFLTQSDGQTFIICGHRYYPEPIGNRSPLGFLDWAEVLPETVGQFPVLRDMHCRDIYEGDILQSEDGVTGMVKWDENEAGYRFIDDGFKYFVNAQPILKRFEVIGNIHDNPHLLERSNTNG